MSGFRLVRQTLSAARQRLTTRVTARGYHDRSRDFAGYVDPSQFPRVRILRPALVCLGTTAVIYLGCAAYEVRQDAARASSARFGIGGMWPGRGSGSGSGSGGGGSLSYDDLEARKAVTQRRDAFVPGAGAGGARSPWLAGLHEPVVAAVGLNAASYLASAASPHFARLVSHAPLDGRSYTLLTSTFGHWGPLHLAVNMYALLQFAPLVMQTPAFDHSNAHAVAFYLGAGAAASLGDHAAARLRQQRRAHPYSAPDLPRVSRGASGVVFALVAALAASEPDRRFGLLFVPGLQFTAQQLLGGLTAVELVGLVWGLPFLPGLGHAAHLAGLATGMAYVHFDGRKRLWQPARRFAFTQMRRLGMV